MMRIRVLCHDIALVCKENRSEFHIDIREIRILKRF